MATVISDLDLTIPQANGGARSRSRFVRAIRWISREPFFQFIALGAVLFALSEYINTRQSTPHIVLTRMEVAGIENNYRLQYGASPTAAQLQSLIDRYIQEEVFYREALKLKLGDNDEIVRRRLVQKYEFLEQDMDAPQPPTDVELKAYFESHEKQYQTPERVTFSQVYFSVDRAGEAAAEARATRALELLEARRVTRAPEFGDSFPGEVDYAEVTATQVRRAFGSSALSKELLEISPGHWAGPFRSGLGWHLVYVTTHEPASLPTFEEARDRVERDYIDSARAARSAAAYARLKARYVIERE
jgi:peptidyl-prolyl cis-trans isomerase C